MTSYVFITGGVVSSLGKGITSACLGAILEARGLSIADLEAHTRVRHLADVEAERFEALPPDPYLEQHVLACARALEIEEALLLARAYARVARSVLESGVEALLAVGHP